MGKYGKYTRDYVAVPAAATAAVATVVHVIPMSNVVAAASVWKLMDRVLDKVLDQMVSKQVERAAEKRAAKTAGKYRVGRG